MPTSALPANTGGRPFPQKDNDADLSASPLLITKLHIPRLGADLIARPHLIQWIDERMRGRLVVVSAPAGSGKTTLLSAWAVQSPLAVAWLSLDEGDNDPVRFLNHLVATLRTVLPGLAKDRSAPFVLPQPGALYTAVSALINHLASAPQDVALILDDYHTIRADEIHGAIAFLIDHLPTQIHVLLAGRSDPPLRLARLRASGQLAELRTQDLRFTPEETALFLRQMVGSDMSPQDVSLLQARTEGWIAGLKLAALSLQGRDDVHNVVESFAGSHRYVVDYLIEEVLSRQPADVYTFLLQTCILDRLSESLCNAVCGQSGSQDMLSRIEQANLFLVPLDDSRQWYRYHRLFVDLLRARLEREHPASIPVLYRRAAEWYAENSLPVEAVSHALAGGDTEYSARLIEMNAMPMVMHGEIATVMTWLAALPEEIVRGRRRLSRPYGWALLAAGRFDEAEIWLRRAENTPSPNASESEAMESRGEAAAGRVMIAAMDGDAAHAIRLAPEAYALIAEDNTFLRGMVALGLGIAHDILGDAEAAHRAYVEATTSGQAAGNTFVVLTALGQLGDQRMACGELRQAERIYREVLRLATQYPGQPMPATGPSLIGLGYLYYEWNQLDSAVDHLTQAVAMGERWGSGLVIAGSQCLLALAKQAQGDDAGAHQAVDRMEQSIHEQELPPYFAQLTRSIVARLRIDRGDMATARYWAEELELPDPMPSNQFSDKIIVAHGRALLALARAGAATRQLTETIGILTQALAPAEEAGRVYSVIENLVLQALIHQEQGDKEAALLALRRALSLAEAEGYVRIFVIERPHIAPLLVELLHADAPGDITTQPAVSVGYIRRLLAELAREPSPGPASGIARPLPDAVMTQPLAEPLTQRELQVLALIAAGASNRDIADSLVISPNTVKKHTSNIFGKLAVASRTQALVRATELGLLPPA